MSEEPFNICTMVPAVSLGQGQPPSCPTLRCLVVGVQILLCPHPHPGPWQGWKATTECSCLSQCDPFTACALAGLPTHPASLPVEGRGRVSRGSQPGHREWEAGSREPSREGMRLQRESGHSQGTKPQAHPPFSHQIPLTTHKLSSNY